jgi:hypothetical protein
MLAGGSVYDNLDYSFTAAHPDGTAEISAPGGGGLQLRAQLATLKRFLEGFDFLAMAPHDEVVTGGVPEGAVARCLAEPGKQYAVYVKGGTEAQLTLDIPPGRYLIEWLHPRSGETEGAPEVHHAGDGLTVHSPKYVEDIALAVRKAR